MIDEKIRCPNKAKYLYSWNGELIKGCEGHAKAMKAIGEAMGIPIEFNRIYLGKNCMHHDNDLDKITVQDLQKATYKYLTDKRK